MLTHCLYLLSQNPNELQKVANEIRENIPSDASKWDYETIVNGLPYLNAALKETLRLYSPVFDINLRVATKDTFVKDIHVKKGTVVATFPIVTNLSSNLYEKRDEFIPQRWIKGDGKTAEEHPHTFIPFSSGARNCIGQHFSMLEAKILMARFLQKYDVNINTESAKKLEWIFRFLYEPKSPLEFICKKL